MKSFFSKKSKKDGSKENLNELISSYANVKDKDLTKLQKAARTGDVKKIKTLGKDVIEQENAQHKAGKCHLNRTSVHYAAAFGHVEAIRQLLAVGAAGDLLDSDKCSPLYRAVEHKHFDAVCLILDQCKPVITVEVVELAMKNKNLDTLKLLVESDESILKEKNKSGQTALHVACCQGKPEVVDYLVDSDFEIDINAEDNNDQTPLIHAVLSGDQNIVRILCCHKGIDLYAKDAKGNTAVQYAANNPQCLAAIEEAEKQMKNQRNSTNKATDDDDSSWKSDPDSKSTAAPAKVISGPKAQVVVNLNQCSGDSQIVIPGGSRSQTIKIPAVFDSRKRSRSPSPNVSRSISPFGSPTRQLSDSETEDLMASHIHSQQRRSLNVVPEHKPAKDDDDSDWSISASQDIKVDKPKLNLKQAALQRGILEEGGDGVGLKTKTGKIEGGRQNELLEEYDDDTIASDLPAATPRSGKGTPRDRKSSLEQQESDWDSESELPMSSAVPKKSKPKIVQQDTSDWDSESEMPTVGNQGKQLSRQESDWDDDTIASEIPPITTPRSARNQVDSDWDSSISLAVSEVAVPTIEEGKESLQPIEEENSWKSNEDKKVSKKGHKKKSQKSAENEDSDWDSSIAEEEKLPIVDKSADEEVAVEKTVEDVDNNERAIDGGDTAHSSHLSGSRGSGERLQQARRDLDSLRRSSVAADSDTTSLTGTGDRYNANDDPKFVTPLGSYLQGVVGMADHPDLTADDTDDVSEASFSGKAEFSGKSKSSLMQTIKDLRLHNEKLEMDIKRTKNDIEDALLTKHELEKDVAAVKDELSEEHEKSSVLKVRLEHLGEQLRNRNEQLKNEQGSKDDLESRIRSLNLELESGKMSHERSLKELDDLRRQFLTEQELRLEAEASLNKMRDKLRSAESIQKSSKHSTDEEDDASRALDDQLNHLQSSSTTNLNNELNTARADYDELRSKYQKERLKWLEDNEDIKKQLSDSENRCQVTQEAMDKVTLQCASLTAQCRNLEAALETEKQESDQLKLKLSDLSDSNNQNERSWNEWADKLEERDEQLRTLQLTNHDLQERVKETEGRVRQLEDEHSRTRQQLQKSNSELDSTHTTLDRVTQELQEAQGDVHLLREKEASLKANNEGLAAQLRDASDTNKTLKSQLEKLAESMSRGENNNSDVQRRLYDILSMMRHDFDKSKVNLEKERIGLEHEIQSLKNGSSRSNDGVNGNSSAADNQLAALMEQLDKVEAHKQMTNSKLASWKQDEYEDRIRHQEVKNTKMEMTLDNERRKNRDLSKNILDMEETSSEELRRICLDMASERDRFFQDSQHYKDMYNQEKRLRHKLTDDLERTIGAQVHASAYSSLERERIGYLRQPSSSSIPAMYTSQQSLYNTPPDPHLQQRLRSELDRSIAKHLESAPSLLIPLSVRYSS